MADAQTADHIDLRPGSMARELGIMTSAQISEVEFLLAASKLEQNTDASPQTFESIAAQKGWLNDQSLQALQKRDIERRRIIRGYEIIRIVGSGTIATTYYAKEIETQRDVALKILHPNLAADPEFVRAYMEEAKAVSRFHHPNIVQGLAVNESNGFYYFAHEFLPFGSFKDLLATGKKFSERRLTEYLRQVNAGLKHAWAVAVYHGDINPGNLLLGENDTVKLANLGVPRTAKASNRDSARFPGFIRALPDYAAPEQLDHPDLVNAATDMYNLGATFFHISFGRPPFAVATPQEVVKTRICAPLPDFPTTEASGLSSKYIGLVRDMMAVDPKERIPDPEALSDRLEALHLSRSRIRRRSSRQTSSRAAAPNHIPGRHFTLEVRETKHELSWGILALAAAAAAVALLLTAVW